MQSLSELSAADRERALSRLLLQTYGAWIRTDLWSVDSEIAADMLAVLEWSMGCGSEVGVRGNERPEGGGPRGYEALIRLVRIAQEETTQAHRVADFLLSWHNASAHGGWNPTDLGSVDSKIAADMLAVLALVLSCRRYPDVIGFESEMNRLWKRWHERRAGTQQPDTLHSPCLESGQPLAMAPVSLARDFG